MPQDRTKDRTQAPGVQMDEDRMPEGQAPAKIAPGQRRQMTKEEHRAATREAMLEDVFANKSEIMKFLAVFGVSYELFEAGLKVFLMKQMKEMPDFFDEVDALSFMSALLRIAMLGLLPDGKEAAITIFKSTKHGPVATPIIGRDGFVKAYWRTGLILDINDQTVTRPEYDRGWFKYIEGDQGYIEHQVDLERQDSHETMAAYCVIRFTNGGVMREVVGKEDLAKIAKMSKSPARGTWKFQMDRKSALRRISNKMPKEVMDHLRPLLEVDDLAYDLKAANAIEGAPKKVERQNLMADRAQHRRRPEPKPIPQPATDEERAQQQAPAAEVVEQGEVETEGNPALAQDIVTTVLHAMDLPALAEAKRRASEAEGLSDEESDWIDETILARGRELGVTEEPARDESPVLRAIISSSEGEVEYDIPDEWRDDIIGKMKVLDPKALKVFWGKNFGFIEAAKPIAEEHVDAILVVATEKGLSHA